MPPRGTSPPSPRHSTLREWMHHRHRHGWRGVARCGQLGAGPRMQAGIGRGRTTVVTPLRRGQGMHARDTPQKVCMSPSATRDTDPMHRQALAARDSRGMHGTTIAQACEDLSVAPENG